MHIKATIISYILWQYLTLNLKVYYGIEDLHKKIKLDANDYFDYELYFYHLENYVHNWFFIFLPNN